MRRHMKIYTYYKGEVHELEVEERARTYISKSDDPQKRRTMGFGFASLFYKPQPLTPMDALIKEETRLKQIRDRLIIDMAAINSELKQVKTVHAIYLNEKEDE